MVRKAHTSLKLDLGPVKRHQNTFLKCDFSLSWWTSNEFLSICTLTWLPVNFQNHRSLWFLLLKGYTNYDSLSRLLSDDRLWFPLKRVLPGKKLIIVKFGYVHFVKRDELIIIDSRKITGTLWQYFRTKDPKEHRYHDPCCPKCKSKPERQCWICTL